MLAFAAATRLIIRLRGHFLFVDQRLVATHVVLCLHIIGLSLFQLRLSGYQLFFGGHDGGVGILHPEAAKFSWLVRTSRK